MQDFSIHILGFLFNHFLLVGYISFLALQKEGGYISLSNFVSLVAYFEIAVINSPSTSWISYAWQEYKVAARKLKNFLEEGLGQATPAPSQRGESFLSFQDFQLYQGDALILEAKDISLPHGHIALVGANGAGKSSLLEVLTGFHHNYRGRIFFEGKVLSKEKSPINRLALYTQQPQLLDKPLRENILLGYPLKEDLLRSLLKELSLEELNQRESLGFKGANLSGGEQQRVALARFLYQLSFQNHALLDEPLTAVDSFSKEAYLALIKEKLWGKSALIVSHDPVVLRARADQSIRVDGGSLLLNQ